MDVHFGFLVAKRALYLLGLILVMGNQAAQAARLALLIGNDKYHAIQPLENASADASAMQVALRAARYDRVELRLNQDLKATQAALREFKALIQPGDEVVVFFSGHGLQIEGSNYLLPVDIKAANADDVKDGAVTLQRVLDDVAERKPAFTLVIVDACRNNPFPGRRSLGRTGPAPTAAANGQMVVYSAGTGQEALDRLGATDPVRNGLFTRIFVKEMLTPGVPITQVVDRVRERVRDEAAKVKHDQMPALYNQSVGTFFFVPPPAGSTVAVVPGATGDMAADIALWTAVKGSSDVREVQAYIDAYGDRGRFIEAARARVKALTQRAASSARAAGSVFKDCAECPELVVVPAGPLLVASSAGGRVGGEGAAAFAMGRYEVTFDEWDACVKAGACSAISNEEGWGRGKRPVINVAWSDAIAYVKWLSQVTNARYRLPGDAEWQYAAGGGGQTKYPWGQTLDAGMANCNGCGAPEFERKKTAPVGSFRPNAFGLYDMIGNVWEWVADCYSPVMKAAAGGSDPPGACASLITRGGSFRTDADAATVQQRRETGAGLRSSQIGLRVLREL